MKPDNLDLSYKYVKLASGLFTFSILSLMIIQPLLIKTNFRSISDLLIGGPILASGVIGIIGFVYGLKGSQYGIRNPKKRFFGLFGNFIFGLILISIIFTIVTDFGVMKSVK